MTPERSNSNRGMICFGLWFRSFILKLLGSIVLGLREGKQIIMVVGL
jgi:hypothetical protein